MSQYRVTIQARNDIREIARQISKDKPSAARQWQQALRERFDLFNVQQQMGESCDDIRPRLRRISHGNYVIYFDLIGDYVSIRRVLHGARDPHGLV